MLITILVGEPDRGTLLARGTSAGAWNIAVRTRGVFTHRDDFQKPACVERGLVRTGKTLGRPGLVRTGVTPVIPESAAPPPQAVRKVPARLKYSVPLQGQKRILDSH